MTLEETKNMKLSEHFTLYEMIHSTTAEKYDIYNMPNQYMISNLTLLCKDILEPIRERYGKPIIITSGYRSEELNKRIGGAKNSDHRYACAVDMKAKDGNNKELWDVIMLLVQARAIEARQIIDEKNLTWIHISRNNKHNGYRRNQILHLS